MKDLLSKVSTCEVHKVSTQIKDSEMRKQNFLQKNPTDVTYHSV